MIKIIHLAGLCLRNPRHKPETKGTRIQNGNFIFGKNRILQEIMEG